MILLREERRRHIFKLAQISLINTLFLGAYLPCLARNIEVVKVIPATRVGEPRLTILRPKPGENFGAEAVVVDLSVANFKLVPPEPKPAQPSSKALGHLHIFLDANPLIATDSRRLMFGMNANGKMLPPGQHRLTVELVRTNHEGLKPRLLKRVCFNTEAIDDTNKDSDASDTVSGIVQ